eukprot:1086938-Amphidinium_carterae.1
MQPTLFDNVLASWEDLCLELQSQTVTHATQMCEVFDNRPKGFFTINYNSHRCCNVMSCNSLCPIYDLSLLVAKGLGEVAEAGNARAAERAYTALGSCARAQVTA